MKRRDFLKTPAAAALLPAGAGAQPRPAARAGTPQWRANWIWTPFCPGVNYKTLNQQQARNSYFYARRVFELPAAPAKALARVSADSRYTLFINGQRIGFGPARCDPRRQCYDVYEREIMEALKPGRNVERLRVIGLRGKTLTILWLQNKLHFCGSRTSCIPGGTWCRTCRIRRWKTPGSRSRCGSQALTNSSFGIPTRAVSSARRLWSPRAGEASSRFRIEKVERDIALKIYRAK